MAPFNQDMPIQDPFVIEGKFTRFTGASGDVSKIAPFPISENELDPIIFVAETVALIEDPHDNQNGDVMRSDTGTVQDLCETI